MLSFEETILNCIRAYRGPAELRQIQAALDLLGIVKSQNHIEEVTEELVARGYLKRVEGAANPTYISSD